MSRNKKGDELTGRWTKEEHDLFLQGIQQFDKQWKLIKEMVPTRTIVQIRTHAQKYFQKIGKSKSPRSDDSTEDSDSCVFNSSDSFFSATTAVESESLHIQERPAKKSRKFDSRSLKNMAIDDCNNLDAKYSVFCESSNITAAPGPEDEFGQLDGIDFDWLADVSDDSSISDSYHLPCISDDNFSNSMESSAVGNDSVSVSSFFDLHENPRLGMTHHDSIATTLDSRTSVFGGFFVSFPAASCSGGGTGFLDAISVADEFAEESDESFTRRGLVDYSEPTSPMSSRSIDVSDESGNDIGRSGHNIEFSRCDITEIESAASTSGNDTAPVLATRPIASIGPNPVPLVALQQLFAELTRQQSSSHTASICWDDFENFGYLEDFA